MKFIFHLLAILYVSASALFTNVKVFNGAYGATVIDGGIWNRIEKNIRSTTGRQCKGIRRAAWPRPGMLRMPSRSSRALAHRISAVST